jgi:hypothetical protein
MAKSNLGRAWTIGELRKKDWEALHQLWWVCVKERNRLATEKIERHRLQAGYGDRETETRDETIQTTMKAILDTLAERQKAWQEAYELAHLDPSVDLRRTDGPQFTEPAYVRIVQRAQGSRANFVVRINSSPKSRNHRAKLNHFSTIYPQKPVRTGGEQRSQVCQVIRRRNDCVFTTVLRNQRRALYCMTTNSEHKICTTWSANIRSNLASAITLSLKCNYTAPYHPWTSDRTARIPSIHSNNTTIPPKLMEGIQHSVTWTQISC